MDNQTEESWLIGISPSELGTGVFLVRPEHATQLDKVDWSTEVESEISGTLTKALRGSVRYSGCVQQGVKEWVLAFKWIPAPLATFDAVKAAAQSCNPVICVRRCAGYGCICITGECK